MRTTEQAKEAVQPKDPTQRDCQRLITEEELPGYLANGWRVVLSGKIAVED